MGDHDNSCIIKLPNDKSKVEIPVYKLVDSLNTMGISIKHPPFSTVTFEKKANLDLLTLKKELKKLYLQRYPTMQIKKISIFPTSLHSEDFVFKSSKCRLGFSKSMLKRNKGTFSVRCGKKNYFFRFHIDATLDVYKANLKIKKDKTINPKATRKETIIFKTLYSLPIYNLKKEVMAKQNIREDEIITLSMITPVPAVKKAEVVSCFIQDGAVRIEFSAKALQNGYIGDEITLKREDGRTIKGVILRKNLVEIR